MALAALASACMSAPEPTAAPERSSNAPPRATENEFALEELPPQRLDPGQCGMFLWAEGSLQHSFVMVVYDSPTPHALYRAEGDEREVERSSFAGARVQGQFERQTFVDRRSTLEVNVTFDENRPLTDGAVLRTGVVRHRDRNGWETLIPVGGMVACQK